MSFHIILKLASNSTCTFCLFALHLTMRSDFSHNATSEAESRCTQQAKGWGNPLPTPRESCIQWKVRIGG